MSDSSDSDSDEAMNTPEDDVAARQEAMGKLVPPLEESDYGKMPASFHANSQKTARTDPITVEQDEDVATSAMDQSTSRPLRQPILTRDRYDGVDSDDETDEEDQEEDPESEEDKPQVVGDIEVDMDEEEEEFLEFSRQALGISDAEWNDIIQDRRERGGKHKFNHFYLN